MKLIPFKTHTMITRTSSLSSGRALQGGIHPLIILTYGICMVLKLLMLLSVDWTIYILIFSKPFSRSCFPLTNLGRKNIYKSIKYIYCLMIEKFHTSFRIQNNLCEFTALEHKFKRWFCTQKPVCFKDFWYTKYQFTRNL